MCERGLGGPSLLCRFFFFFFFFFFVFFVLFGLFCILILTLTLQSDYPY